MSRRKSSRETVPVAGPSFERSPAARSHQPAMSSGKVLRPVIRMTSAQSVVAQLVDMIRTGNWKAGDRLPTERALAETMGVGRSTIREALQNLAALNVIEATAGHGTVVKAPEPGEFFRADLLSLLISDTAANELLEARAMIEPDCAWLAARRGTEEDMAALAALLDEHQKAHDENRSVVPYGAGFHVQLARTAHNRVAVSFMESILDLLEERGKLADQLPGARTKELADHRYLFSLVSQRKADEARQAMLEHIVTWASSYDGTTGATLQDLWTT